jgi:hypothetical protein
MSMQIRILLWVAIAALAAGWVGLHRQNAALEAQRAAQGAKR